MTLVLLDHWPAGQLERTQHASVDLDVVALGQRRGLDEVDEQRRRLAAAGKRTPAAVAICHGAEHDGLGVAGLERENVGGQCVHLTPVEPLKGPLGHREQLFESELGHCPLSPGLMSRVAARPRTSRIPAVHKSAAPAVVSRMALPQNENQSSIRSSDRYEESLSLAAAPSQSWTYSCVRAAASRARSRHPSWLSSGRS